MLADLNNFEKLESGSAVVPFFEGEDTSEKMGNWKIKFKKLENEMERTLAKIAGSSCSGGNLHRIKRRLKPNITHLFASASVKISNKCQL